MCTNAPKAIMKSNLALQNFVSFVASGLRAGQIGKPTAKLILIIWTCPLGATQSSSAMLPLALDTV